MPFVYFKKSYIKIVESIICEIKTRYGRIMRT